MNRSGLALTAFTALGLACARPVPLTDAVRGELAGGNLADQQLQVLGSFELHGAPGPVLVLRHQSRPQGVTTPDDSTIVLTVTAGGRFGAAETLELTFRRSALASGAYTLRAVNGSGVGEQIPVRTQLYHYVPCYTNVGWQCGSPIATGAREDREVRVGIVR
jgi:hypothetical protein